LSFSDHISSTIEFSCAFFDVLFLFEEFSRSLGRLPPYAAQHFLRFAPFGKVR